jgi:hypothetical protein
LEKEQKGSGHFGSLVLSFFFFLVFIA